MIIEVQPNYTGEVMVVDFIDGRPIMCSPVMPVEIAADFCKALAQTTAQRKIVRANMGRAWQILLATREIA